MDTACPRGWRRAFEELAATPFIILIPGHGDPMNRAQLLTWKDAFATLLDCAGSDHDRQACIRGWLRDAATFIPARDEDRIGGAVG